MTLFPFVPLAKGHFSKLSWQYQSGLALPQQSQAGRWSGPVLYGLCPMSPLICISSVREEDHASRKSTRAIGVGRMYLPTLNIRIKLCKLPYRICYCYTIGDKSCRGDEYSCCSQPHRRSLSSLRKWWGEGKSSVVAIPREKTYTYT